MSIQYCRTLCVCLDVLGFLSHCSIDRTRKFAAASASMDFRSMATIRMVGLKTMMYQTMPCSFLKLQANEVNKISQSDPGLNLGC